jgi:predicted ATPase
MTLDTQLTQLENSQLVRRLTDAELAYLFKHGLIRDTAYASLLRTDRKRLHLQVARSYETLFGERGMDEHAAILAQHYAEAGDDAKT